MKPGAFATLAAWTASAALSATLAACGPPRPALQPVPLPQAAAFEPSVQDALARARADLERAEQGRASDAQLAQAYGDLGMSYHAHNHFPGAEAAYENARRLAPQDPQWPYLLGQVSLDTARPAQALQWFETSLSIAPADAAALHALGRTALQQGSLDKAQQAFERLREIPVARPAALAGLGKVALARRDPVAAAALLEEALRMLPGATKLRHPLAMAYRGAGDEQKAQAALKGYSPQGPEPGVPDPLADIVADKAATSSALVRRGLRHGREGRFDLAAAAFEAALKSKPDDAPTLVNLGLSLANLGQLDKAEQALRRSVEVDPSRAEAQFGLAVVLDRLGRDALAAARYEEVLKLQPAHADARVYLADARLRAGRAGDAAELYAKALGERPTARVRLSLAFALVKAGQWQEARAVLERALAADPRDVGAANALVRILASAPDDAVRDGARALQVAQPLFDAQSSPEVGQTLAMAFAESGEFDRAVDLQTQALDALSKAATGPALEFPRANLARYRERRPARQPWPADHPAFQPRSPAAQTARPPGGA
jgi:tetratricopeptide (TPR) repeat protein